ncbi:GntR family transcriptional regulator [Lentibacillus populi]|uniref:GntR family transcriptional regulator n=1 Tax=Lentibacillus populi TaxID=1827502 RepID=A0A9W5TY16_9BACI|nr:MULTISPECIES: FadR/GntR family transcriptional regulator [Bacillaceae]GGB43742.1 GntR family transcriptional regulator [Lentibacillus populi]
MSVTVPSNRKRRVYQMVVEHIKSEIENKEILPGDKLPSERVLAARLSVSRTSVKEAFSVLESNGLIEIKHGSGVTLREDNVEDIIMKMNLAVHGETVNIVELMELRQAIEGETSHLAAIRCNDEDIKKLHQSYVNLEKAVKAGELAAKEDLAFHMSIAKIARNLLISEVMYMVSDRLLEGLKESRAKTFQIPGKPETILEEHKKIMIAIRDRNPKQARAAMYSHLQKVKQRYL